MIATVWSLALISTWPLAGAGSEGGDHRVAMSLAVQVDARRHWSSALRL